MDYLKKYKKYKRKYTDLKKEQIGGNLTQISGPVSFYYLKIPGYNKKIYLFGDHHFSWHNTCYGGININKPGFHESIINKCDAMESCYFITTFLQTIFDTMKTKVNFYSESPYHKNHQERIDHSKKITKRYVLRGIPQKPFNSGPLHYIDHYFKKFSKKNKHHEIKNIDIRNILAYKELYTKLGKFMRQLDRIDNTIDKMEAKKKSPEEIINTIKPIIPFASNNFTFKNITDEFKVFLNNALTEISIPDIVSMKIISEVFRKTPTKIQTKIQQYIKQVIGSFVKKYNLVMDYKNSISIIKGLNINLNNREDLANFNKKNTELHEHLSHMHSFLLELNAFIVDIFVLSNIFSTNDQHYVIYMGNDHIKQYVKFISENIKSVKPISKKVKYYSEDDSLNKNDKVIRCVTVNRSIKELASFF